ncbi:alpha-1,3-galactosidase-related protein [Odoribacter lunatus]|uniref:alpha-1,3-galactosidase-related protein n=1 Tax=Odoribacter lunatus TaxID=2941335 RepID=UPI00203F5FCD|nr:alpha-1,3-galactosidase B [Odoribacter lunatus]
MRKYLLYLLLYLSFSCTADKHKTYDMTRFGILPDTDINCSPLLAQALSAIREENPDTHAITLRFAPGRYNFHETGATEREYYISNHDQPNPKKVGIALEDMHNLTLDGQGASFVFHGRMLPLALLNSRNCTLKNFSIDFEHPHIAQIRIIANSPEAGITFEVAPWVNYRINDNGLFETYGEGWSFTQNTGIAFEGKTKHVVYRTSDLLYNTKGVKEIAPRRLQAPLWKDKRLLPGTVIAMRSWARPAPGLFLSHNLNTHLQNIQVHYAEGMGLLAQLCENITLDGFGVCLKGDDDPRYFTTQADATHFSGCKGKIISCNGRYEGMMDDAINIHGTYLKITQRLDDTTVIGRYMHGQSYGFEWGRPGDTVQFIRSATMDLTGTPNRIASIHPHDRPQISGAKEFVITFDQPLDPAITEKEGFGIENLTWTPEVLFCNNLIRNNRARGALFSTPRKTVIEHNTFDHTSGTAILLCGDCNGWYETGACREVIIRHNTFINALTNMFQFTNAIISIYPEIPDLPGQQSYFHGGNGQGVIIENNLFETFDQPIVYAKSLDGLVFKNNTIRLTQSYSAFHWNRHRFLLERVTNIDIRDNDFEGGFNYENDVICK